MSAVELAPEHKVGLTLPNPCMPAAGCYGFGQEYSGLVEEGALGAVVFGPVTARPHRGSEPPRLVEIPGGVLVHTGLANPGAATLARRARRVWGRLTVPVIVHIVATSPDEVATCCGQLSALDMVAGFELGLADDATPQEATQLVAAARTRAGQPLLVRLPLHSAEGLCRAAVEAGASALTVGAAPRGTLVPAASSGFITGRLYGPFVLPLALRALRRVRRAVEVPLVGCGGIHTIEDARAFLRAGAAAIQVDSALWRDPSSLAHIARALAAPEPPL